MQTRVVAVANQKGGVGKTTTAINLAACLGELGQKVLVIDLDPQANATSGLGLPTQKGTSFYSAMLGDADAFLLIQTTPSKNVDIVPSEIDLAGCEVDIPRRERYLHVFQDALRPIVARNQYDFVIIDCPPSLGILTMNALAAAESILIPMQCEYYALEGLSVITMLTQKLHDSGANPVLRIEGIVMTMFDGRTNLSMQVVNEVTQHFPDKVYRTPIPRNVRLSEAPSFGKPIITHDPHSTGAKAYRELAAEFLARAQARAAVPAQTPVAEIS
jgi:chromosome partitioning protein